MKQLTSFKKRILAGFVCVFFSGCVTAIPPDVLKLAPESLEQRQLQTRRYETKDEKNILSACAGVLQDLGFAIEESETKLGVIVASKDRSAVEASQIVAATAIVFLAALGGITSNAYNEIDATQKMRASVISAPSNNDVRVRVTFQRIVWNRMGQVSKIETINEQQLYEGFFEKLSKSIFLETQKI